MAKKTHGKESKAKKAPKKHVEDEVIVNPDGDVEDEGVVNPDEVRETHVKEKEEEKRPNGDVLKKGGTGPSLERLKEVAKASNAPGYQTNLKVTESRKLLEVPVPVGMRLFETPEGEILLGEAKQTQIWSRNMNNGQGGWANPRR